MEGWFCSDSLWKSIIYITTWAASALGNRRPPSEMFRPLYVFLSQSNMTTGKSKLPKREATNDIKQHTSLLALKAAI